MNTKTGACHTNSPAVIFLIFIFFPLFWGLKKKCEPHDGQVVEAEVKGAGRCVVKILRPEATPEQHIAFLSQVCLPNGTIWSN